MATSPLGSLIFSLGVSIRAAAHPRVMITITLVAPAVEPMAAPLSARFDESGGTIGRSPDSTLVLPDADRKISRTHATISFREGTHLLRDHGTATSTMVNGKPVGHGREVPLAVGDEIRIGVFSMRVSSTASATPVPGKVDAAQRSGAGPDTVLGTMVSWRVDQPAQPRDGITTVFVAGSEGPVAAAPGSDSDPLSGTLAPPPNSLPAPNNSTRPISPKALAGGPTNPAGGPTEPVSNEALLHALLKGAGVEKLAVPGGLTPELMRDIGRLLHDATAGLLDLLAARAATKRQVRANLTVIVAADNNPLKFSPDLSAALTHLLVPRGKGFMPPVRAVADAFEDLGAHQAGFMAGMHSALAVVLARFDPKALEQRLTEQSMVDSFLPTTRKAKLWDQFGQLYGSISRESEQDFQSLFGEEFLAAYRRHARRGDPNATRLAD